MTAAGSGPAAWVQSSPTLNPADYRRTLLGRWSRRAVEIHRDARHARVDAVATAALDLARLCIDEHIAAIRAER